MAKKFEAASGQANGNKSTALMMTVLRGEALNVLKG